MIDAKTQALIIKYLRKAWLYSPARRQVIKEAETGEKNPEGEKTYWCKVCKPNHVVVKGYIDHKTPVILLPGFDTWTAVLERLFDVNNQQFICKLAHSEKTKKENKQRKRKPKNVLPHD